MYNQWDIAVRELGGGIWFFTNLALALVLLAWAVNQFVRRRKGLPFAAALVGLSLSMAEVLFGSAIRGFITWQQFRVAGNGGDPTPWVSTWPWLGCSIIMNICGAAACTWLILPPPWRTLVTFYTVTIAILVPLSIFYLA